MKYIKFFFDRFSWKPFLVFFAGFFLISIHLVYKIFVLSNEKQQVILFDTLNKKLLEQMAPIDSELDDLKEQAELIAHDSRISSLFFSKNPKIASGIEHELKFLGISLLDNNLNNVLSGNPLGQFVPIPDAIPNAVKFLSTQVAGLYISESNKQRLTVSIATPVFFQQKLIGLASISLDAPKIAAALLGTNSENQENVHGIILSQQQNITIIRKNSNTTGLMINYLNQEEANKFPPSLALKGIYGQARNINGASYFYKPVPTINGGFFIEHVEASMLDLVRINIIYLLFFILLFLPLSLLIYTFLNNLCLKFFQTDRFILIFFLALVFGHTAFFTIISINKYINYDAYLAGEAENESKVIVDNALLQTNGLVNLAEFISSSLSEDISDKKLIHKLINNRLKITAKNYDKIYAINVIFNDKNLDWPSIKREAKLTSFDARSSPQLHDYWAETCSRGTQNWSKRYDYTDSVDVISFCAPIYENDKKIIGYVLVSLKMDTIRSHLANLSIANYGYLIAFDSDNKILYHPHRHFLEEEVNLDYINSETNEKNILLLKNTNFSTVDQLLRSDQENNDGSFIRFVALAKLDLRLAYISFSQIIYSNKTLFTWYGLNIAFATLSAIALIFLISSLIRNKTHNLYFFIISVTAVLLTSLALFWIKLASLEFYEKNKDSKLNDAPSTELILNKILQSSNIKNVKKILFGIEIDEFFIKDSKIATISGRMWQVRESDQAEPYPFHFKEALDTRITSFGKFPAEDNDIKWLYNFNSTIIINDTINFYPFDIQTISLTVLPNNLIEPVVFVPDFNSYPPKQPGKFIGISPENDNQNLIFNTNFSMFKKNDGLFTHHSFNIPVLTFNIEQKSSLTNAWILYGLPQLIILSALFIVILLAHKEINTISTTISACLALLFATLLLHSNFSSVYVSKNLIYMELLLISSYLMILIIFFITAFSYHKTLTAEQRTRINSSIVTNYWSLLFTIWLFITFYWFFFDEVAINKILMLIL